MNKKKTIIIIIIVVVIAVAASVIGFGNKVAKAPESLPVVPATSTIPQATSTASSSTSSSTLSVVISTSTIKKYIGAAFAFDYPGSWSISKAAPLLMTNFNGQYKGAGVIPTGGAQLSIVTTTISGIGDMRSIMATELAYATNVETSTVVVGGSHCIKTATLVNYAPGATVQNVSVYCPIAEELWKIYFSYPAGDPKEQADLSAFSNVLGSMKLFP